MLISVSVLLMFSWCEIHAHKLVVENNIALYLVNLRTILKQKTTATASCAFEVDIRTHTEQHSK